MTMINLKPEIRRALKVLNVPVYPDYPDQLEILPCITFYEAVNQDRTAADDAVLESYIEFYIHVWGENVEQIEPLVREVDLIMKELGFWRSFGMDDFKANVKRKVLRYSITKEG